MSAEHNKQHLSTAVSSLASRTPQEESLLGAIEGDFSRMSHADLVETCKMLTKGRERWKLKAEKLAKALEFLNDACREEMPEYECPSDVRQALDNK